MWKVYRSPILEYVDDAILLQTVQSLSDERTVSPDDAEAKHVRVVASGLQVLCKLLGQTTIPRCVEIC